MVLLFFFTLFNNQVFSLIYTLTYQITAFNSSMLKFISCILFSYQISISNSSMLKIINSNSIILLLIKYQNPPHQCPNLSILTHLYNTLTYQISISNSSMLQFIISNSIILLLIKYHNPPH